MDKKLNLHLRTIGARQVEEKLLNAGWHRIEHYRSRVVSYNPYYPDATLGISDSWYIGGIVMVEEQRFVVYIYPDDEWLLSIFGNGEGQGS